MIARDLRKLMEAIHRSDAVKRVPWRGWSPGAQIASKRKPVSLRSTHVARSMTMPAAQVPWKYPFKPVRATWSVFQALPLSNYLMEKKYDGWRAIVQVQGRNLFTTGISLWTREKRLITMPDNLNKQLAALEMPDGTLLDGEIWNMSKRGAWKHNRSVVCALTLWDAIRFGHQDLSGEPIEKRRQKLEELLAGKDTPDIKATEILPADEKLAREIDT